MTGKVIRPSLETEDYHVARNRLPNELAEMRGAKTDPSPSVRLRLASVAQKLPASDRWPILAALAARTEDMADHNLPLMTWYAAEGAVASDPVKGVELLKSTRQPRLHQYIARRVLAASLADKSKSTAGMAALSEALRVADSGVRAAALEGMLAAAKGHPRLPEPDGWADAYGKLKVDPDIQVSQQARSLALIFGSASALAETRALLANNTASLDSRRGAIEALVVRRDADTLAPLLDLATRPGPLRGTTLQALANYDDPRIALQLVSGYPTLNPNEKSAALATLVARPASIEALIAAVDAKRIPGKDINAPVTRLIQGARRKDFDEWLTRNFGSLNPSNAERQADIVRYRKFLSEDAITSADVKNGRAVFQRTCAACHHLFGQGGNIGPELPGNFADTDYLLQNVIDPNAIIGRDYQQTFITMKDGNFVAGVVTSEDDRTLSLKTLGTSVTLSKDGIAKRDLSPLSMMPVGLLNSLEETEVRDLFLYLRQSKDP